jgi:hypothetical protein
MLSKKTSAESTSTKIGALKNTKKKSEASFGFSDFPDDIRIQAYYNYLKRMKDNMPGDEMTDWLEAEISVRTEMRTH